MGFMIKLGNVCGSAKERFKNCGLHNFVYIIDMIYTEDDKKLPLLFLDAGKRLKGLRRLFLLLLPLSKNA